MAHKHYEKISDDFEKNWFFTDTYFEELSGLIAGSINLQSGDSFADLGCGTGNYTHKLVKSFSGELSQVLGVDFSQSMLSQLKKRDQGYLTICSGLEEFVNMSSDKFDKVLLKEVIHHLDNPKLFYQKLKNCLKPNGQILIVTRPQKIEFPFFNKALEKFSKGQTSQSLILEQLNSTGLETNVEVKKIVIKIKKNRLFKMIENRFMSTFHEFSDQELNEGLKDLEKKYKNQEEISFFDKLLFIKTSLS